MSLKNKFFSALTVAFALFAFSSFAAAQDNTQTDSDKQQKREWRGGKRDGKGKGFRRGGRGGFMRGFRDLNLSDAQKEQIRTIMEANRPDQATMEEMRTIRQAKRDGSITPEQKERAKALREQAKLKGDNVQQQLLAVLTPEQRQQYEAKKAEMKQKWEERRQERQQRRQQRQTQQTDDEVN